MSVQINIKQAEMKESAVDVIAKALCEIFDGNIERTYVGIFLQQPYEEITSNYDINKTYFYDKFEDIDGKKTPSIYAFRFWGYQAEKINKILAQNKYDLIKRSECTDVVVI